MKNIIKNYWKTALVTFAICYLCFAPPKTFGDLPSLVKNADKIVHFFMFFVLAMAIYLDFRHNALKNKWAIFLFCWIIPILFGLWIEAIQYFFLPLRTGDLKDWFFDSLGYIHGFVTIKIFYKIKERKNGTTN